MTEDPIIRLHPNDNVAVARVKLQAGQRLEGAGLTTLEAIPAGHKVALAAIAKGAAVLKYDQVIGEATEEIAAGAHVHVQNLGMAEGGRRHDIGAGARATDFVAEAERASFQGFRRPGGRVGTRNFIGILTSVNCSATVARMIAARFPDAEVRARYPNVDGVVALTHSTGCGMVSRGEGWDNLHRTLWGDARHPNFAGVLMVGLGCEVNQIDFLLEAYGIERGPHFRTMTIQGMGGTANTVAKGAAIVEEMLAEAEGARRETVPAGELAVALQCGGSDGYSGISANPALGAAVDLLVRHGGTAVLSETPEIYGAEHLLTSRAAKREVGERLIERIAWWEDYVAMHGGSLNNNPSPGNKAGGLTTILEKSLGAAAKGGTTNLNAVYKYAEPITERGFVFMDTPGYDPCSITGQIAGGCTLVCFTTGRGSVSGFKPAPCLKLATNTAMYRRMTEDMDIDCGPIVSGEKSVQQVGAEIFKLMLATASGQATKSEAQGFGDNEFVPWQIGAVL